jgi:site-specific recombinase XerD
MTPTEAAAVYQDWRRGQHLAESTVKADEVVLKHWIRFCRAYGLEDVREADKPMLLALAERVRHGKSARGAWTKNYQSKILWTVRDLFRYLHETERVLSDITLGLPPLHKAKHLPRSLMNRRQIARLLHQPNLSTASLFLISTNTLRKRFQKHRDTAHLGDIYTVHSLRHSCATEMLRGGASVRHVQELLGHSSIDTTQDYTRVVIDDLQKSHSRTAPGNRRQEAAFVPFNRKTATWRQEKKRRKR